jgi:glycosyltransferase involved in cell wall biosynthesis
MISNKKILFVMNSMNSGGAERVVSILANEFSDLGATVTLVLDFEAESFYELGKEVEILSLGLKETDSAIKRNLTEIKQLTKLLKEYKPDIVISFIRNIQSIVACRLAGIPIIISERNNPRLDPPNKVLRLLRRFIYPFSDKIVFQTESAMNYFPKYIRKKGIIIKNPIKNIYNYKTNFLESKEIISAGRLETQKDHITLIKAFENIIKFHPQYHLSIYGEGRLRSELEEYISNHKIDSYVSLPGTTKDLDHFLANSAMFVLPSIYEGYPNVLIEAMVIGLPVISTDCAYGPRDIIRNNENGILVPVSNITAMELAIKKLIDNKELSKKIANNALEIRNELDVNKILKKWIDVIVSIN